MLPLLTRREKNIWHLPTLIQLEEEKIKTSEKFNEKVLLPYFFFLFNMPVFFEIKSPF